MFNVSPQLIGMLGQSTTGAEYNPVAPAFLQMIKDKQAQERADAQLALEKERIGIQKDNLELSRDKLEHDISTDSRDHKARRIDRAKDVELRLRQIGISEDGVAISSRNADIAEANQRINAGRYETELKEAAASRKATEIASEAMQQHPPRNGIESAAISLLSALQVDGVPPARMDTLLDNLSEEYSKEDLEEEMEPGVAMVSLIAFGRSGVTERAREVAEDLYDKELDRIAPVDHENQLQQGVRLYWKDGTSNQITLAEAGIMDPSTAGAIINHMSATQRGVNAKEAQAAREAASINIAELEHTLRNNEDLADIITAPLSNEALTEAFSNFNVYVDESSRKVLSDEQKLVFATNLYRIARARSRATINTDAGPTSFLKTYQEVASEFMNSIEKGDMGWFERLTNGAQSQDFTGDGVSADRVRLPEAGEGSAQDIREQYEAQSFNNNEAAAAWINSKVSRILRDIGILEGNPAFPARKRALILEMFPEMND